MGEGGKVADKERKGLGGKRGRGGYKARGWVRTFGAYKPRLGVKEPVHLMHLPTALRCTKHRTVQIQNTKCKIQTQIQIQTQA